MDNNTLIINEKYLKKYSLLPLNYQMNEVMPFITMSQDIWLKPVLGTAFYEELLDQVGNNNLTDENATLLVQAAWPYLSTAFDYEYLPFAYAHISEVGVTKGKSDNSDSVDLKDITYLQSQIRKNLGFICSECFFSVICKNLWNRFSCEFYDLLICIHNSTSQFLRKHGSNSTFSASWHTNQNNVLHLHR